MTSSNSQPSTPASAASLDAWFTPLRFGVLLGVLLAFAFPAVLLGTQSFFRSDYGVLAYPFVHYHRESFWHGEIPLWNPLSNCGAPFLAQWGTMVLYPGSLIYLLLPLPWSLGLFCLLHLWLGGVGMFRLAERWTGSRFAGAVAGTVFVFNGITLACLIWPNYTVALGWMPWIVLLVERAWREGGRTLVLAALAASMQMLAGTPEIVVFTWLVLGALALLEVQSSRFKVQSSLPLLGRFALIIALVSALCAAQLLPFFDLLAHSQRDPTLSVSKWALPAWGWVNLLVPLFRFAMTPQGFFFQQGQEFLTSCYVGTVALALALLAVWRMRERRVWLLALLAVFAVLMAMGNNGPLFPLVQKLVPIVGIARYPVKFLILVAFVASLLVAFGVKWCLALRSSNYGAPPNTEHAENLLTPASTGESVAQQWQPLFLIATLLPAVVLLVLWWMGMHPLTKFDQIPAARDNAVVRMVFFSLTLALLFQACRALRERTRLIAGITALACIAGDGLTHVKNQNPTIWSGMFAPRIDLPGGHRYLVWHGHSRMMISPEVERELLISSTPDWYEDFYRKRIARWSNLNVLDDMPKVNGSSTLRIREQDEVQSLLYSANLTNSEGLLAVLGVGLSVVGVNEPKLVGTRYALYATSGRKPVFLHTWETLPEMASPHFDPYSIVYLTPESRSALTTTALAEGHIDYQNSRWDAHSVALGVTADAPALVVIAQTFYHPWKAYIDEKPVPLLRANHAFQALEVPAGTHRVRLAYEDRNFRIGSIISLATLALCGVLWRRDGRERVHHG